MKRSFVTISQSRAHAFTFGRTVPIGSGSHRAGIGCEADEHGFRSITLAHQLADIEFAIVSHVSRARIAQVRVVLPDGHSRRFALGIPMLDELVERFRRIMLAYDPGFVVATG